MYIRKATAEDLPAVKSIYDGARIFMQENGNGTQWVNGYPTPECSRLDVEAGILYVCAEGEAGTAERTSMKSAEISADPKRQKAAAMSGAEGRTEGAKRKKDRVLAVFVFSVGEDPTYRYIEDGAWLNDAPYGVIHRIAVSESARGKGAAAFCMEWAFQQIGNLRIDTHENNIPMQRLIQKCGFLRTGRIYAEDGTPRIAFQKLRKEA